MSNDLTINPDSDEIIVRLPSVIGDLISETVAQDVQWGEQNHPDGTPTRNSKAVADRLRTATQVAAAAGTATWADILKEEVFEALAETGPELRTELIQVAAVALQWAAAIDRREEAVLDAGLDERLNGSVESEQKDAAWEVEYDERVAAAEQEDDLDRFSVPEDSEPDPQLDDAAEQAATDADAGGAGE